MFNVRIKLVKEYMKFTDDSGNTTEVQGIRIVLGPKIEKFITMQNLATGKSSNFELLGFVNPNLAQWYSDVPVGTELYLIEQGQPSAVPANGKPSISEIYSNSENQL